MPTVGLEYRYPFISVQSWGTQTIEPIAQIIVRPNETSIGKLPNEDSQSLIFDDSNLFRVDKFAGWDRVEGGGRANVGVQYTAQFNRGGIDQRAVRPVVPVVRHQLVRGRRQHQHRSRQRPRHQTVRLRRARSPTSRTASIPSPRAFASTRTLSGSAVRSRGARRASTAGRFRVLYGKYDAQPLLGFLDAARGHPRQRLLQDRHRTGCPRRASATTSTPQVRWPEPVSASAISTIASSCALNYITNYTYSGNVATDQRIMLQFTLRTLGGTAVSQSVGGSAAGYNRLSGLRAAGPDAACQMESDGQQTKRSVTTR